MTSVQRLLLFMGLPAVCFFFSTDCAFLVFFTIMGPIASAFMCMGVTLLCVEAQDVATFLHPDFSNAADRGNYTCDEITRWMANEKHYSNDKRELLFGMLANQDCFKNPTPVVLIDNVSFGAKRKYFQQHTSGAVTSSSSLGRKGPCKSKDEYAVTFLSNFSINNNFSHFLHGLLRLFCALLDAQWIVWDASTLKFKRTVDYTIWLDEYFKSMPEKLRWLEALTMGGKIRPLSGKSLPFGECVTASTLLYGSGCVKLLPPEKWHGYPHCRAREVLPAFGQYMRQVFDAQGINDLTIIDHRSNVLHESMKNGRSLRIAFAVRDVGDLTGRRVISNLAAVQKLLIKTQHIKTITENVTFEHFDVPSTVRYMARYIAYPVLVV